MNYITFDNQGNIINLIEVNDPNFVINTFMIDITGHIDKEKIFEKPTNFKIKNGKITIIDKNL